MLMEKTDLSLFREYLPSTYLNLDKQQDNQTSKLNIHANGSIFLMNSGNKTNSGNYYLPNSIVKTEDAPNGYYVLSSSETSQWMNLIPNPISHFHVAASANIQSIRTTDANVNSIAALINVFTISIVIDCHLSFLCHY